METENVLPTGSAPLNIDQIIEQSKTNLAEATAPKRGRGRPPGSTKKNLDPQPESSNENSQFKSVDAVVLKENEIEPLSAEIVKAPFDVVGWRTGIDVTPTDEEAKAPTKYLSKLIECYLPDLDAKDPKKFNLIALIITFALLSVRKLRIFATEKRKKQEIQKPTAGRDFAPAPEAPTTPKPQMRPLPTESQPAANLFNRGPLP